MKKLLFSLAILLIPSIALATEMDFSTINATSSFTVPAGVSSIQISAWGAGSTDNGNSDYGGAASGTLAVSAGQIYYICIGGPGSNTSTANTFCGGGSNGNTGNGGGGGGMTSFGTVGTNTTGSVWQAGVLLVAGGAGGGMTGVAGGNAGGLTGSDGASSVGGGGLKGTQSAGGNGGAGSGCSSGTNGSAGQGGAGGVSCGSSRAAGSGGGGYFGGGGGGQANSDTSGGGGGGSSFASSTMTSTSTAVGAGHGFLGGGFLSIIYTAVVSTSPTTHLIRGTGRTRNNTSR